MIWESACTEDAWFEQPIVRKTWDKEKCRRVLIGYLNHTSSDSHVERKCAWAPKSFWFALIDQIKMALIIGATIFYVSQRRCPFQCIYSSVIYILGWNHTTHAEKGEIKNASSECKNQPITVEYSPVIIERQGNARLF